MDEWQAAQFSKPFPMYYKYILLSSDVYLNIYFARNNCTLALAAATYVLCKIQSGAETRRFNADRHLGMDYSFDVVAVVAPTGTVCISNS